jgi:hypothetical protein
MKTDYQKPEIESTVVKCPPLLAGSQGEQGICVKDYSCLEEEGL